MGDGKCGGDTKSPLCPKDSCAMMEPAGRALDNWIQVREGDERSFDVGEPLKGPADRKKDRIEDFEVKCGKGLPKFKCDFIIDHTPTAVTSLKASKCTHRKNFKITIECTDFTTTPAPTTTSTTTEAV